jgi:hypothetical protein
MTACCDEYGCRRKQPIHLYLGELTGQVFAATHAHERSPGHWTAYRKHDVTEAMREFIRRNPAWVREQLEAS